MTECPTGTARWAESLRWWWDLGHGCPVVVRLVGSDDVAGHVVDLPSVDVMRRLLALPSDREGARRLSWRALA